MSKVLYISILAVLLVAATLPLQAQIWNQNLIVNGDAESGAGMSSIDPSQVVKTVPGWKTTGAFTVVQYSPSDGIQPTDPGPVNRGNNYFAGGFGATTSSAAQTIDVSAGAAEIDAGRVRFYLSAYLMIGDYGRSTKSPNLTAAFKDGSGKVLLTSVLNGPTSAEGGDMQVRAASGFILPNTRSVDLLLELTDPAAANLRGDGFNLSSADNLSLVLTLEPLLGRNLVVNGDAETSPAADGSFFLYYPVPGWNATNCRPTGIHVDSYTDLGLTPPNPTESGGRLFVEGNENNPLFTQLIDVTLAKDRIDSGGVNFHLAAELGGDYRYTVTASVQAEFLDSNGKVISSAKTGLAAPDLGGVFGLFPRSTDGPVPAGTRMVRVALNLTEQENSGAGAWADNISLTLNSSTSSIMLNSIVNAATGQPGAIAPGEMVLLNVTGINLDSQMDLQLDSHGLVSTSLGTVIVYFDGVQAPLLSVNSSQIEAIAPFALDGASKTVVTVQYQGVKSNSVTANVAATAPGIFTQPPAANTAALIYDSQWALVTSTNPSPKGSVVTIIFTGAGQTSPPGIDGHMENLAQEQPKASLSVTIDGQPASLVYAGTLPFLWDGLMMAQVKVPSNAGTAGPVPVVITAGGVSSPAKAATTWVK